MTGCLAYSVLWYSTENIGTNECSSRSTRDDELVLWEDILLDIILNLSLKQYVLSESCQFLYLYIYIGIALFATRIAQSCGGGGGPGTGRGKRDDEDNFAFRRRCFGMAMKMMRPGHQQRQKR